MTDPTPPRENLGADLVERLRAKKDSGRRTVGGGHISLDQDAKVISSDCYGNEPIMVLVNPHGLEAAALIERLLAENAKYREALKPFAEATKFFHEDDGDDVGPDCVPWLTAGHYRRARAALSPGDGGKE